MQKTEIFKEKIIELVPSFEEGQVGRLWVIFSHLTEVENCSEIVFNQAITSTPEIDKDGFLTVNLTPNKSYSFVRKIVFPMHIRNFRIYLENEQGETVTLYENYYTWVSCFDFTESPIPYHFINSKTIKITFSKPEKYNPGYLELFNPVVSYSIASDLKLSDFMDQNLLSNQEKMNPDNLWEGVMILENMYWVRNEKPLRIPIQFKF